MKKESYHFIGIGGIGMSGLARILLSEGISVTGSDLNHSGTIKELEKLGAVFFLGNHSSHVQPGMTVVYSSAVKQSNPEYKRALSLKCSLLHRSDLLKQMVMGYKGIAIAGTHGKTSTSSLLAAVMCHAGLDPSYAVGGILADFNNNGAKGKGEYFILEADESDGTFVKYPSFGAIVTNIEKEHLDHYRTEKALHTAFKKFISQVHSKNLLFTCEEDPGLRKYYRGPSIRYGFVEGCDLRAYHCRQGDWGTTFDVSFEGKRYLDVKISLPGRHNVLNALAVFGMALRLGVLEDDIRRAFLGFKGVARRCQKYAECREILFIDDYAHHPTEIESTLQAVRASVKNRRIVAVFQPHRYSRTRDCMKGFSKAFVGADHLVLTDIYGAGESPIAGVCEETLLHEIKIGGSLSCEHVCRENLLEFLSDFLHPFDVALFMGAGDITAVARELYENFAKCSLKR